MTQIPVTGTWSIAVKNILSRLGVEKKLVPEEKPQEQQAERDEDNFPVNSYIVASYKGDLYLGQVLNKSVEPEADQSNDCVYVNFMERWPVDNFLILIFFINILM